MALSSVFEEVVYHGDIKKMFDSGYLAPAEFVSIEAELELDGLKVGKQGDFTIKGLGDHINTPPMNAFLVETYLKQAAADRDSTLVFCVDLDHVKEVVAHFKKKGVKAKSVSSKMHISRRKKVLQDFTKKRFPVLVNCE